MPYSTFSASHHHFLVLGTPGYPEDWLLDKLQEDGADIRVIAEFKSWYRDRTLYEVTENKKQ